MRIFGFGLAAGAVLLVSPLLVVAETLRVATYDAGFSRDGAGVLLHDLGKDEEADIAAAISVIQAVRPDVLLLTRIDHDLRGDALAALVARLAAGPDGIEYAHLFHAPVNAGEPSGFDLDGDGRAMGADDAWGWGKYPGHGGMALLSRLPIDRDAARTFRELPWSALPDALLPVGDDGEPWPDAERQAAMRLSSRSHWDVPVILPHGGRLHVLAANPTPPLFDGPEKRNRRRNHDEIVFWAEYLDGRAFVDDQGRAAAWSGDLSVVMGDLNADPADGAGLRAGIGRLLTHPGLQDPVPESAGSRAAANPDHSGPSAADTADWRDDGGPGNLRVDYVLPDARLRIEGAGVFWPAPGEALADAAAEASDHRLVWVDLALD